MKYIFILFLVFFTYQVFASDCPTMYKFYTYRTQYMGNEKRCFQYNSIDYYVYNSWEEEHYSFDLTNQINYSCDEFCYCRGCK